jgi:hypothetical protein
MGLARAMTNHYTFAAIFPALLLAWAPASRLVAADQPCRDPVACQVDNGQNLGNGVTKLCQVDTTTISTDLLGSPITPYQQPVPQWSTSVDDNDPKGWPPVNHCAHWYTIDQKQPNAQPVKGGECGGQGLGTQCHPGA